MTRPLEADVDVAVIGVPDEAVAAPVELPIELVQNDVAEQRGEWASLREGVPSGCNRADDAASAEQPNKEEPCVGDGLGSLYFRRQR